MKTMKTLTALALICCLMVEARPAIDRPGDAPYTPTKLEWATLELQANYGRPWNNQGDVDVSFHPAADGKTVLCLLQYTPETPAGIVETMRTSQERAFQAYKRYRDWSWLRLQFHEKTVTRSGQ